MLSSLLTGRSVTRGSAEVGQLAAADWWEQRGWRVPPLPPACECLGVWGGRMDHQVAIM